MRRNLLISAILIALAGCAGPEPGSNAEGTSAAPATATSSAASTAANVAATAATPACSGSDCGLLPENVVITISHQTRSNRTYVSQLGASRQQVAFEYKEGTPATAVKALEQSLTAAGFVGTARPDSPTGVVSMTFKKDGYGQVNVWANPDVGPKPRSPDAKGVLGIDFPAPGAVSQQASN